MFGLGTQELLIIFGIVIVLFGAKRLPQLGSGVGKGIRNFKKGLSDDEDESSPLEEPHTKDKTE
ncbi:MAG: twin-arginine translocase TatA/TatE family subunit [Desulfuromonadaceae bacterium]|jgi:sec-independent protein translocase protein TatA|nr:twin-arginine translocase TatA/TatE family subunit [Desulfuromonas sp.]MDY0185712.1 twin-arginine translocase TatA/TatE family subunit [Desulfuromonadaceae bacterium]